MNKRVTVAFAFGCALLLASYTFAPKAAAPTPSADPTVGIVAAPAPVRQFIPTTDSNNDGIPDWQEDLLAAEPLVIEGSDSYEAPDTLTDEFAVTFFEAMIRNEQYGEFGQTPEELAARAAAALAGEVVLPSYTLNDINPSSNNSVAALTTYAETMNTIAANATPSGELRNELVIVDEALRTDSPAVLEELVPIREGYEEMLAGFLNIAVPSSLSQDHLVLVTAISTVLEHIKAFELTLTDPLLSLIHVQLYEGTIDVLAETLTTVATKLDSAGVTYVPESNTSQGMIEQ